MAKKAPKPVEIKNQKDLMIWSLILGALLVVATGILWKMKAEPESNVHIPTTAFEKKPLRERSYRGDADTLYPTSNGGNPAASSGGRGHPSQASTELQRAMTLVDRGNWPEAESILLAELAKNPNDEGVLIELAMLNLLDKHDGQAARPYLEAAIRVNPKNDAAIEELLGVYEEGQNWNDAVRFFESIPESESPAFVNYGKGTALLSAGRNTEAVDVLKRAVYEDDNKAFTARESLATAFESTGRWEEASREYESVISGPYKPEQIRIAKIRLANTYAAQKNFGQARALLEPIVQADPKDRWAARVLDQIDQREKKQ